MVQTSESEHAPVPPAAPPEPRWPVSRLLRWLVVAGVAGFLLIQLVPMRVSNPSVNKEPPWDSPRTRQLAVAACFDCHSNRTSQPWYTKVAPVAWWTANHVDEGRARLNFSECGVKPQRGAHDAAETVTRGSMPPSYYTWLGLHSNAKLTAAERQQLADGLRASLATCGGNEDRRRRGGEGD